MELCNARQVNSERAGSPRTHLLDGLWNPAAFGPLIAALVLTWWHDGRCGIRAFLRRELDIRFSWRWLVIIIIATLIIFSGSIALATLLRGQTLDCSILNDPIFACVAFFVILLTSGPLQEEFGWRGLRYCDYKRITVA